MRLLLEEDLAHYTTLQEVQDQTQSTLRELRKDGFSVHYVAGPISCDGEAKIPENIEKLIEARSKVMHALGRGALVFTAPFIFSLEPEHNSYTRLRLFEMDRRDREAALQEFWDQLLESGTVNGVHFVDGWQRSPGAKRERLTAEELGIPVFDVIGQ